MQGMLEVPQIFAAFEKKLGLSMTHPSNAQILHAGPCSMLSRHSDSCKANNSVSLLELTAQPSSAPAAWDGSAASAMALCTQQTDSVTHTFALIWTGPVVGHNDQPGSALRPAPWLEDLEKAESRDGKLHVATPQGPRPSALGKRCSVEPALTKPCNMMQPSKLGLASACGPGPKNLRAGGCSSILSLDTGAVRSGLRSP